MAASTAFNTSLRDIRRWTDSNGRLKGFAVLSSDAAMLRPQLTMAGRLRIDPQARLDYGYNAVRNSRPWARP